MKAALGSGPQIGLLGRKFLCSTLLHTVVPVVRELHASWTHSPKKPGNGGAHSLPEHAPDLFEDSPDH